MRQRILWTAVAVLLGSGCPARDAASPSPPPVPDRTLEVTEPSGVSSSPTPSRPAPFQFVDRTAASGVEAVYRNGEEAKRYSILESMGGGGGLCDLDRDGRLDLILAGGGGFLESGQPSAAPQSLWRQDRPWHWSRCESAAFFPPPRHYSHGISIGDFDHDGFPDVAVTGYGGVTLARNLGDGTFESTGAIDDSSWSTSAAWGDVNGDGNLDLFVAHYVNWSPTNDPPCEGPAPHPRDVCPPRRFDGLPSSLFLSHGDGRFTEESEKVGVHGDGKGIGVVAGDIDLDGDVDFYVGNDTVPNNLYINEQGSLNESAIVRGVALNETATADGSMGVDLADANLDGLPDIAVANYQRETFGLYCGTGEGMFQHASRRMGLAAIGSTSVSWGTAFLDIDLDGDEDLVISNGHVVHFPVGTTVSQFPALLENLLSSSGGSRRFVDRAAEVGGHFARRHHGRGFAAGDLDGDGDEDLLFIPVNEPGVLLENRSGQERHWISVELIGRSSPRCCVGAYVEAVTAAGTQIRLIKSGGSYASSRAPGVTFGLGDGESVDELRVHWPGGRLSRVNTVGIDQRLVVVEPEENEECGVHILP